MPMSSRCATVQRGLSLGLPAILLATLSACDSAPHPGQLVWENNCQVCHGPGLAGAPVFGDSNAWQKRLTRGIDSLYGHALNGWGDMPARGGNATLTDQQVRDAVDYMVAAATP